MKIKGCLYFPKHGVVYINNPKAGCTTFKRALSGDYETTGRDFHIDCNKKYLIEDFSVLEPGTPTIFISRDPVKRFHSCYQDKVKKILYAESIQTHRALPEQKRQMVNNIRKLLNLPNRSFITMDMFIEFVRHELRTVEAGKVNSHFRPQADIIRLAGGQPHFIGRLEDMPELWDRLQSKFNFSAPIVKSLNVSDRKTPLQAPQIEAIKHLYSEDIEVLNY
jgi:hypothetical protein